ncbi:hypothetical protein D9758_014863 [Tetrapyrgos nigripes]|uniref:Kinesin motor domain-containing protein n=1 Tax=Tetrapyrgos nigripes TaxID=182062 RepID=A0A8H5CU72_9AGAR|nr:hypothetical protein D9758_014863 [Tetrapyrgos nigripes]
MSIPSTPASKLARPTAFTPKRPLSASSSSSSLTSNDSSGRLTRVTTPLLASTHKKYKAPLSSESRARTALAKPRTTLAPVPGTPTKPSIDGRRTPGTPTSPRKGAESPSLYHRSEMDVSNVDPEEVLVDFETVEPGDVSAEMDEAWLKTIQEDHGKQDKVMVSVRIRPPAEGAVAHSAWTADSSTSSISLDPSYAKNHSNCNLSNPSTSSSTSHSAHAHLNPSNTHFTFNSILTGVPNKPIYTTVAKSHVLAAMEGFNAVIFAYGQTASGKTYTLSGDDNEPGIIPRAMRDVFGFIKRTPGREYLLRCSYLEIYNETIYDLLAPAGSSSTVQLQGGMGGTEVILTPLREEVVTSLKGVREVLKRGMNHRRTACTDWNERSSRSHSVFRLVIESRERNSEGSGNGRVTPGLANGRATPGMGGRATPASGRATPGAPPPTPGGPRLQARDGRSVQMSVLSLIDLAGSEKATSDKDRTREGKYINTSLLTLGSVIGTLAENAARNKTDHIPYRNSKLTRLLAPSLSGNARISVICTINPDPSAIAESTSTLGFARRVGGVKLNAKKKILDGTGDGEMEALIERYRKEIDDLKRRLEEKEKVAGEEEERESKGRKRRLSKQEKQDESKAMRDLQNRIQQLTKLILTSQTVDESTLNGIGGEGGDIESRPVSPIKVDFDLTPYQLQQELLSARLQLDTQATQILSLEAALEARPPATGTEDEKDKAIADQAKTIRELEIVVKGYEGLYENAEAPQKLREDVEKEMEAIWKERVEEEKRKREEKERWAEEVVKQLEKERTLRTKLEDERRALTAFVTKFDSLGLGSSVTSVSSIEDSTTTTTSSLASSVGSGIPPSVSTRRSIAARRSSAFSASSLSSSTSTITGKAPRASLGVFSGYRSVSGGETASGPSTTTTSSIAFPVVSTPKATHTSRTATTSNSDSASDDFSSNASNTASAVHVTPSSSEEPQGVDPRLSILSTASTDSPIRLEWTGTGKMGSLLEEEWVGAGGDLSFEGDVSFGDDKDKAVGKAVVVKGSSTSNGTEKKGANGRISKEKENLPV